MKLTKGKLSKLFHKKKQTMRRYKNQRKYRRASKTFRQRKPLNLHRSSMKNMVVPRKLEWIGGTEPDEKVPLVVKPASDEATITTTESITEPVPEAASEPTAAEEPVPEPVAEEPVSEEPVAEPVDKPIVAEHVNPEPASTTPSVEDALNLIADKIATAVVTKMRENPATGSTSNQDADIAVPLAVSAVVRQTQLAPEK